MSQTLLPMLSDVSFTGAWSAKRFVVLVLLVSFGCTSVCFAELEYDIRSLGANFDARAINDGGWVAGVNYSKSSVYVGKLRTLMSAGSTANAINSNAQIVGGYYHSSSGQTHAYVLNHTTSGAELVGLGVLEQGSFSEARGVNTLGQVVGYAENYMGKTHSFVYRSGTMLDLGAMGGMASYANSINDAGDIAGEVRYEDGSTSAYLYRHSGDLRFLPELGEASSVAWAINNNGVIVGSVEDANGDAQAFRYLKGEVQLLGALGGSASIAYAVNKEGQIVGSAEVAPDKQHAFIYDDNTNMQDLNDWLPDDSPWELVSATGINDKGQITGNGIYNGVAHGFLMSPVQTLYSLERPGLAVNESVASGFGKSVAISENTMVVGLPNKSIDNINNAGMVHVYRLGNDAYWSLQQTLTPEFPVANDYYGAAVAVAQNTIVVGAPGSGSGAGTAFIYQLQNDTWVRKTIVNNDGEDPSTFTSFGRAVDVDDRTVVVGANGAAYIYHFNNEQWVEESRVLPSADDLPPYGSFGSSVAIDADTMVVGAKGRNGAAYVYSLLDNSWILQAKFVDTHAYARGSYGVSVAISGDTIAVGRATPRPTGYSYCYGYGYSFPFCRSWGGVYVYTRAGDDWGLQEEVLSSERTSYDGFGASVALDNNTLVVGTLYPEVTGITVYQRSYNYWIQQKTLTTSVAVATENTPTSVAIDKENVAIAYHGKFVSPHVLCPDSCVDVYSADISVNLVAQQDPVEVLQPLVYVASVTNYDTENSAKGIVISSRIPDLANYYGEGTDKDCHKSMLALATIECSISSLAPGETLTKRFAVTAPAVSGLIEATARVEALGPDSVLANNETRIESWVRPMGEPEINLESPHAGEQFVLLPGEYVSLSAYINGWIVAEGGDHFHVWLNGADMGHFYTNGVPIDVTGVTQGENTVCVVLTAANEDATNNKKCVTFEVLHPALTITSPEQGQIVQRQTGDQVLLKYAVENWTATASNGQLHWMLDGKDQGEVPQDGYIDISALSDGTHTIAISFAVAIDEFGSEVTFTLETFPPEIIIGSPKENKNILLGLDDALIVSVAIKHWPISESSTHFHWRLEGDGHILEGDGHDLSEFSIGVNAIREGNNQLTVVLANADHSETAYHKSVSFTVGKPQPTVSIVAPKEGALLAKAQSYKLSVTEQNQQFKRQHTQLYWFVNGEIQGPISGSATIAHELLNPDEQNIITVKLINPDHPAQPDALAEVAFRVDSAPLDSENKQAKLSKSEQGGGALHGVILLLLIVILEKGRLWRRRSLPF